MSTQPKKTKKPTVKAPSLLDKDYEYVPASSTDIRKTWAKFGWKPVEKLQHELAAMVK